MAADELRSDSCAHAHVGHGTIWFVGNEEARQGQFLVAKSIDESSVRLEHLVGWKCVWKCVWKMNHIYLPILCRCPLLPVSCPWHSQLTLDVKIWDLCGSFLRLTKANINRNAYISAVSGFQVKVSTILNAHQIPNALPPHPVPSGMTGLSKANRLYRE